MKKKKSNWMRLLAVVIVITMFAVLIQTAYAGDDETVLTEVDYTIDVPSGDDTDEAEDETAAAAESNDTVVIDENATSDETASLDENATSDETASLDENAKADKNASDDVNAEPDESLNESETGDTEETEETQTLDVEEQDNETAIEEEPTKKLYVEFLNGSTSHIDARTAAEKNVTFYCVGTSGSMSSNSPVYSNAYLTMARWRLVDENGNEIANSETDTDWSWDLDIAGTTGSGGIDNNSWNVKGFFGYGDSTLISSSEGARYVYNTELGAAGMMSYGGYLDYQNAMVANKAILYVNTAYGTFAIDMSDPTGEQFLYHEGICDAWGLVTQKHSEEIDLVDEMPAEEIINDETHTISKGSHVIGSGRTITIVSTIDFKYFKNIVRVDGEVVSPENYVAYEGSTCVTFNSSYLDTLAPGSHTVTLVFSINGKSYDDTTTIAISTDGAASQNSNSASTANNGGKVTSPQTGYNNDILWIGMMICLVGSAGALTMAFKKQRDC